MWLNVVLHSQERAEDTTSAAGSMAGLGIAVQCPRERTFIYEAKRDAVGAGQRGTWIDHVCKL